MTREEQEFLDQLPPLPSPWKWELDIDGEPSAICINGGFRTSVYEGIACMGYTGLLAISTKRVVEEPGDEAYDMHASGASIPAAPFAVLEAVDLALRKSKGVQGVGG